MIKQCAATAYVMNYDKQKTHHAIAKFSSSKATM